MERRSPITEFIYVQYKSSTQVGQLVDLIHSFDVLFSVVKYDNHAAFGSQIPRQLINALDEWRQIRVKKSNIHMMECINRAQLVDQVYERLGKVGGASWTHHQCSGVGH